MFERIRQSEPRKYGLAIAATLIAMVLTFLLRPHLEHSLTILLFAAVVVSAYLGGLGPGLASALLGVVLLDLVLLPPGGDRGFATANEILSLLTFSAVGILVSSTADHLLHARKVAERHATEARIAREDAEAANKAKAEFLASMSHDLRTPLSAIAGYTELLEMEIYGPISSEQRQVIDRIRRSKQHLLGLVEQVLSFAKIDAGRVELDIADVPVDGLLARAGDMIGPQLNAKGLRYVVVTPDRTLMVRGDASRLDQVMLNLLSNAVKFTEPGGTVTVACAGGGPMAEIRVSDTGPGIPQEKRELIFQPFVQLPHKGASAETGTGLGLAISRQLARAMGGNIECQPADGGGSSFVIRLPVAGPKAPRFLS